ncbi:hypothetical protein V5O48_009520 [Marasmius crinis-equi]|uniref:F-box domain-containing protein n=1 Tax=Marasmius crinis-equi TaxID=585013 RepID=A0ABR3FB43_9AGAR
MSNREIDGVPSFTVPASTEQLATTVHPVTCSNCNFDFATSQNRIKGPSDALYSRFSHTNSYPSPHEDAAIQGEIAEAITQISFINDAIGQLRETMSALDGEKHRLEGVMERYRSILRPVHRLPPEILSKIFRLTLDFSASSNAEGLARIQPPSSLCPLRPPWVPSQVCRSWRQLALGTPDLWTFVSFGFPTSKGPALRSQLHRLQLQLQRSANHSLDIITRTPSPNSSCIERFLIPLCSYSPNWQNLRIELNNDAFFLGLPPITGRLQELRSLHLHIGGAIAAQFGCFRFAPQLTKLSLSGGRRLGSVIDDNNPRILKLPYRQITHYRWEDDSESFLDMDLPIGLGLHVFAHSTLLGLRNLQSCRLLFHSKGCIHEYLLRQDLPQFVDGTARLSFHHLLELELHTIDMQTGIHAVLPWIAHAPSLKKLTIFSSGPDRVALSTFLTHPQNLTYLSIPMVEMPPNEFSAVLSRIAALTDLLFGAAKGITDGFISLFLPTHPETGDFLVVPNLRNLTLFAAPDARSSYSEDMLLDVLETRSRVPSVEAASSPSKLLSVSLDKPVEGDSVSQRLDQLRIEGLQVGTPGEDS